MMITEDTFDNIKHNLTIMIPYLYSLCEKKFFITK